MLKTDSLFLHFLALSLEFQRNSGSNNKKNREVYSGMG